VIPSDRQPRARPHVVSSLIISSRDRHSLLAAAVKSVMAGTAVPDELIVVDQSESPSPELSQIAATVPSWLRYTLSDERGLSRGRNLGIALARGQWLCFIDDDVVVTRDWFARLSDAMERVGTRTVITGRVLGGEPEQVGAFAPSLALAEEPFVYRGRPGKDVLHPHNMAVPRTAFDEIGLFDARFGTGSRFPSSEDNDLGFRLLEAGYAIAYDPTIIATHRAWRTPRALLPVRWSYGRGQGAYFLKHATARDRYMLRRLQEDLWRHVKRVPGRATQNVREAAGDLVYSAGVIVGAIEWLASTRRRHSPSRRLRDGADGS
jgi:GT2 family glycosyltransferase